MMYESSVPSHLQHQKSIDSTGYFTASSIEAYDEFNKSNEINEDIKPPLSNIPQQQQQQKDQINQSSSQLSKLAIYAMHLPIPEGDAYQHERNQRLVTLYGFGTKKLVGKISTTNRVV